MSRIVSLLNLFEYSSDNRYKSDLIKDLYNKNYVINKKDYSILIDPIVDWFNSTKSSSLRFSPTVTFTTVPINKQDLFNDSFKKSLIIAIENTLNGWNPISGIRGVNSDNKIANKVIDYLKSIDTSLEPYKTITFEVTKDFDNKKFEITYYVEDSETKKEVSKIITGNSQDFKKVITKFFDDILLGSSIYFSLDTKL